VNTSSGTKARSTAKVVAVLAIPSHDGGENKKRGVSLRRLIKEKRQQASLHYQSRLADASDSLLAKNFIIVRVHKRALHTERPAFAVLLPLCSSEVFESEEQGSTVLVFAKKIARLHFSVDVLITATH